jgi:hypothetical protein
MLTKKDKSPSRHGLRAVKERISIRSLAVVDKRSAGARALFAWRTELIDALGGADSISPQQLVLIELACRGKLFIDHCDAFLLEQPSLINKKRRAAIPILLQRAQLAAALERTLMNLGLHRIAKPVEDLDAFLKRREQELKEAKDGDAERTENADDH